MESKVSVIMANYIAKMKYAYSQAAEHPGSFMLGAISGAILGSMTLIAEVMIRLTRGVIDVGADITQSVTGYNEQSSAEQSSAVKVGKADEEDVLVPGPQVSSTSNGITWSQWVSENWNANNDTYGGQVAGQLGNYPFAKTLADASATIESVSYKVVKGVGEVVSALEKTGLEAAYKKGVSEQLNYAEFNEDGFVNMNLLPQDIEMVSLGYQEIEL